MGQSLPSTIASERATVILATGVLALLVLVTGAPPVTATGAMTSPPLHGVPRTSTAASGPAASGQPSGLQCDGVYWASWVWANYSPSWCYGHDEATVSFISDAPGSGEDANYSFNLPADGNYTQGDFYATIWLGGVVYDPGSLDDQAYLEFQFYPAPPTYTGPGSGTQDCLPGGEFAPDYTPGSNEWFACADVWQVSKSTGLENAAFAGPLDASGTTDILVLHSDDEIYVNESGVAQSTTIPWNIQVSDPATQGSGSLSLTNGTTILSPYYQTAAEGHYLLWGADTPGAVALAYEIGHSLNPDIPETGYYEACYPGDSLCDSYWPGRWAQSGQMELSLPVLGAPGSQTYPTEVGFGSSVEGENWINGTIADDESSCTAPSFSTAINCLYPWYTYVAQNYSFTFGANNATNTTHNYGYWYQFPGAPASIAYHPAPWGTLDSTVYPTGAKVEFNPLGRVDVVAVHPNGTAYQQFMEGPYWLNVSYPGCISSSTYVYLGTGSVYDAPIELSCPGLFPVTFTETGLPVGTVWSVIFNESVFTGDSTALVIESANGTQYFEMESPLPGAAGVQYLATPANGSVDVQAAPTGVGIAYATEYSFLGTTLPRFAGSVSPSGGWYSPGTTIPAATSAYNTNLWSFAYWSGLGAGSYSGVDRPASVVMYGPVQETAVYSRLYSVIFSEKGLPDGTNWSVTLKHVQQNSTATVLSVYLPNGSYTFSVGGSGGFVSTPGSVTLRLEGNNTTVTLQFAPPPPHPFLGLTAAGFELLLVLIAAVVIAGVLGVVLSRRRSQPPRPPPPPPPPWVGGPK